MTRGMLHVAWVACLSAVAGCQMVAGIEETELFEDHVVRGVAGGVQDPGAYTRDVAETLDRD